MFSNGNASSVSAEGSSKNRGRKGCHSGILAALGSAECSLCPAGRAVGVGSEHCATCSAGMSVATGSDVCTVCGAGTKSAPESEKYSVCPARKLPQKTVDSASNVRTVRTPTIAMDRAYSASPASTQLWIALSA